jgi:hypothetical protein
MKPIVTNHGANKAPMQSHSTPSATPQAHGSDPSLEFAKYWPDKAKKPYGAVGTYRSNPKNKEGEIVVWCQLYKSHLENKKAIRSMVKECLSTKD